MRRTNGFSLIEAVVAIAIMAILAGAVAPLVVKSLNQQKAATTQANLQAAWQAAFGIPGTRVQNMRADYGFSPTATTYLGAMITYPGAAVTQAYGTSTYFSYGWNGPYWNGPTTTANGATVPADAWGNPVQLVVDPTSGNCQMVSPGGGTQLVYPSAPVSLSSAYMGSIYLNLFNPWAISAKISHVLIEDRRGGVYTVFSDSGANPFSTIPASTSYSPASPVMWPVMPGPVYVSIMVPGVAINDQNASPATYNPAIATHPAYNGVNFTQVLDILPGQSQTITITLN